MSSFQIFVIHDLEVDVTLSKPKFLDPGQIFIFTILDSLIGIFDEKMETKSWFNRIYRSSAKINAKETRPDEKAYKSYILKQYTWNATIS